MPQALADGDVGPMRSLRSFGLNLEVRSVYTEFPSLDHKTCRIWDRPTVVCPRVFVPPELVSKPICVTLTHPTRML